MSLKFFITGTDTNVGKTYISVGILNAFNQLKYSTLGIKPIATGCTRYNGILQNEDALLLQHASSIKLHYHQINPFAFEPAISPNIAAQYSQREINVHEIKQKTQYALQYPADICLIEGAGGWYAPINQNETIADYVKTVDLKTILVIGLRLGCLNHTLLTYKAMLHDNINIAGWIANCIDPNMHAIQENILTLQEMLPIPCLGIVGYQEKSENVIDVKSLMAL